MFNTMCLIKNENIKEKCLPDNIEAMRRHLFTCVPTCYRDKND